MGLYDRSAFIFYAIWMCICCIDNSLFQFAQICQCSDFKCVFFFFNWAMSSSIHFFSKCSQIQINWPESPPKLPQASPGFLELWLLLPTKVHLRDRPSACTHSACATSVTCPQRHRTDPFLRLYLHKTIHARPLWTDFIKDVGQWYVGLHYRNAKHFN